MSYSPKFVIHCNRIFSHFAWYSLNSPYVCAQKYSLSLSLSLALALASVFFIAPFTAQASLYLPGATLNPDCAPTDSVLTCGISTTIASSTANSIPFYAANGSILSATSTMTILSNGNVGIGTTSPFAKFSIAGIAGGTTNLFAISTSTSAFATTTALTINQNGDISLGNGANLSVSGLATFTNGFLSTASSTFSVFPNIPLAKGNFIVGSDSGIAQATSTFYISSTGNVGIGTTTPAYKLDVNGGINGDEIRFNIREPQALVTFVFDDNIDTDYTVMKPVFDSQGEVACSAIITSTIGNPDRLSATQIVDLENDGWEILSHTVTHPHLPVESEADIRTELSVSKSILEALGLTINGIVYPWNENDETVRKIARDYYKFARGGIGVNSTVLETYKLYAESFSIETPLDTYKGYVDTAESENKWLIFYLHGTDANDAVAISELIDYIQAKNISIVTMNQALNLVGNMIDVGDNFAVGQKGIRANYYANDNSAVPQLTITQDGSGDAGLRLSAGTSNWSIALDNSLGDVFSIENTSYGVDSGYKFSIGQNGNVIIPGKVGIGTTTPYAKLSVEGSSALGTSALAGYFIATTTTATSTFAGGLAVQGMKFVVQQTSGNVGIGTTSPYSILSISNSKTTAANTPLFSIASTTNGTATTTVFSVASTGDVTINGSSGSTCTIGNGIAGTSCSSDERLKTNIALIVDPLQSIEQLRGVTFNWADQNKSQTQFIGVIAQDVQKVFPQAVSTVGGYLAVDYGALVAPLIEAVKELARKVDDIKQFIVSRFPDSQTLCLGDTCVTESQLKTILQNSGQQASPPPVVDSTPPETDTASSTDPIIIDDTQATTTDAIVDDSSASDDTATSSDSSNQ